MPYDPTSDADIQAAIRLARHTNSVEPDMRKMVESLYLPPQPQKPYQFGDIMGEMTAPGRRDITEAHQTQQAIQAQYPEGTIMPQMSEADRAKMREAAWQKLSGFGSTVYNAAAAAIPDILPSFIVGEPWQRKQLARDIAAMPDAFAGMGSAMVGPSYERAANLERRAMFPDLVEGAAPAAVQTAKSVLSETPAAPAALENAEMLPALVRSEKRPDIKLSAKQAPKTDQFFEELYNNTYQNPMNPREEVFGNAAFTLQKTPEGVHLSDIRSLKPKSGAGTRALNFITDLADKHNVPIEGVAQAYMEDPKYLNDTEELAKWYQKHGFEVGEGSPEEGYYIAYNPKQPVIRSERMAPEAAEPAQDMFAHDNPGVLRNNWDWVKNKQAAAEEGMASYPPETATGKGLIGSATAYTRKPVELNTDFLSKIPGAMDEKRVPGDTQYDELRSVVEKEGWNPDPIMVGVNHKGQPYIMEGNTRVAVAKDMGIPSVPAEVRFLNGGELAKGEYTPDVFAQNIAKDTRPVIRSERMAPEEPAATPPAAPEAPVNNVVIPKGMKIPKLDARDTAVMQRLGTTAEDQKLIADTIKRTRDNYHPRKGFDDFEVVGGKFENTRAGERIFVPQIREKAYGFDKPPEGVTQQQWATRLSNKLVNEVKSVVNRARRGDQSAIDILKEARWYRDMRDRLRHEFGGLGDLFADLLGTTSAQTGVTQNWNNAVEILRRFSRGDYDREIAAYEQRLRNGQSVNPIDLQRMFKAGQFPLITKASGELFNANSPASTRALLDMFREIRAGASPKTPNFTGNLIGYSNRATIDVWAARLLRRLAGKKPIPPAAEQAVTGKHLTGSTMDNPLISGEFGFGQQVFDRARNIINNQNILKSFDPSLGDLGADDLQAVAWFIEKEGWTNRGWTSKAGEGGSLNYESNLAGAADPERVKELRKIINEDFVPPTRRKRDTDEIYNVRLEEASALDTEAKAMAQDELNKMAAPLDLFTMGIARQRPDKYPSNYGQAELAASLDHVVRDDPSVMAYQLNNTIGRFMGENERALNAEFVVRSNFNPQALKTAMVEAGKEYDQDAVFLSKLLRSPNESANARPGIAIYFRNKLPQNVVEDISNTMTQHGVDGFTFVTDARQSDRVNVQAMAGQPDTAGLVGIRFQYIPEFDDAFVEANRAKIMADKQEAYEDIVSKMLQQYPQISTADVVWYDTDIVFKGDYDAYLARVGKARGGEVWQGQPYRSNAQRSISRATGGKVGSGDIYHRIRRSGGQDWSEADIQAALNVARHHRDDGGRLEANTDPLGYLPVTARPPEDRNVPLTIPTAKGPYHTTQEEIDRGARRGQFLYDRYVQPIVDAVTLPGEAAQGNTAGMSNEELGSQAMNLAGLLTLGAGAVPAEANALRIGFSGMRAKTADQNAIKLAKNLLAAGKSPEEVWQATGYFPHPGVEIPVPVMARYEQPVGLNIDVAKMQQSPRYNTPYRLPDVFQEKSFEAAYPDYYNNTGLFARWRQGKQPEEGAAMSPAVTAPAIGGGSHVIKYPQIFMGDVSKPGYQMTKGEIGSLAHEINHVMQDIEKFPIGVPASEGPMGVLRTLTVNANDPRITPEQKAAYQSMLDEFQDLYNKNPRSVEYALYLHDAGEAMSRIAEKMAAYPELRQQYPLNNLDVNPDWIISYYRSPGGKTYLSSDAEKALSVARWASTPEGKAAMAKNGRGEEFGISRLPMDPVAIALRTAKGNQP